MPCNDENKEEEVRWDAAEDADSALEHAKEKLENRLKVALGTCGLGAVGGLTGLGGLIAGGSACITALLLADDAAIDYDLAVSKSALAHKRHSRALRAQFMCLSSCGPVNAPEKP